MNRNDHSLSILTSLDRESFLKFIFEMWKVDVVNNETDYVEINRLPHLEPGAFEAQHIHRHHANGPRELQTFSFVVPFFQPIDLFLSDTKLNLSFNKEAAIVRRYNQRIRRKMRNWYWPQDGEFTLPNILFVSNMYGVDKVVYLSQVLPSLQRLIEPFEALGEVGVGTYDSFLEYAPAKTEIVLRSLFTADPRAISFSIEGDKIVIQSHRSEGYLRSGVLPGSLSPCETVMSGFPRRGREVFREFEDILNRDENEDSIERFLRQYFREVFGNQYDRMETQLWLKFPELDIDSKERRIDIFLRNAVERDWELVELKRHSKIISRYRDIPTLSAEVCGAIGQLKNYGRILQQDRVKKKLQEDGIEYFEPQLRLVIGGKPDIPLAQWRRIKCENEQGLRITTLEEMLAEMKFRLSSYLKMQNIVRNE